MAPALRTVAASQRVPNNLYSISMKSGSAKLAMPRRYAPGVRAREEPKVMQGSDGEELRMCPHCSLPVGELGYVSGSALVHGECKAQLLLAEARADEECRQRKDAMMKKKERAKYNIGWKQELIPRNSALASQLPGHQVGQNMCCLSLQNGVLRVVPTADPAASVNLEYLSLALRVRLTEGREPLFSLDMQGAPSRQTNEPEDLWQVKRYEPAWLAGTSVGDVLFQADYHLKELSMGECEQPVMGMMNAFDLSKDQWHENDWRAREWFVVNQAEIRVAEGNMLIPHVQMGVEAREQTTGPNGLEDSVITRSDHPLVKYAEAFTHNFDLIAERKSSVFHLRELAKASVLARYLLEAGVEMEDAWLDLAPERKQLERLEIPQLWNQRSSSQLTVRDGKVLGAEGGMAMGVRGVYGGVQFGLDKFDLGATTMQPGAGEAPYSLLFSAAARGAVMARGVVTPPSLMEPRGVDLNLNKFDLSETVEADAAGKSTLGEAFWADIAREGGSIFAEKDRQVLKQVFNSHLSDRRADGDLFVPPNARTAHMDSLRVLIEEELCVKQKRKELFFGADFTMETPGHPFPPSWTDSFKLAQAGARSVHVKAEIPKGDFKASAPVFDKTMEDGARFRIYSLNGIEVRTIQESDGDEMAGAAFSVRAPQRASLRAVPEDEKVIRATEYVEKADGECRFYIVLETEQGSRIATEKLADGSVTWDENFESQELRDAEAKVLKTVEARATVKEMKAATSGNHTYSSCSERKRYAHGLLKVAVEA